MISSVNEEPGNEDKKNFIEWLEEGGFSWKKNKTTTTNTKEYLVIQDQWELAQEFCKYAPPTRFTSLMGLTPKDRSTHFTFEIGNQEMWADLEKWKAAAGDMVSE